MGIPFARLRRVCALALLALAIPAATARAGTVFDYPEFPYPVTNYQEDNRGQFHFSPRAGWMNDPNGLVYYKGEYHMYFQHNPHGLQWDTMHWGHATSTDLVHWVQKPIALEPGVHPGNLWSGGGIVDTANVSGLKTGSEDPIIVYSGTDGVQIFYSNDGGNTFQAYEKGARVAVPDGTSRDPKVTYDPASHKWTMVVWSDGGGNGVNIYTSTDLLHWTFASRFSAGWLFECPDLVQLPVDGNAADKRWVLSDASGEYVVGDLTDGKFTTDWTQPQRMDLGRNYYAALTFTNVPDDKVIQLAWQNGNEGTIWTGNMTFPVQLGLTKLPEGLRVTRNPVDQLASIRTGTKTYKGQTLTADKANALLNGVQADTYEIEAEVDVARSDASRFGLRLHTSPNGTYDRQVEYDKAAGTLNGLPLPARNGVVKLHLLVDRGQLEVFGNDGTLSASENDNFDTLPGGNGVQLYANGRLKLLSLKLHDLARTWGTGESTLKSNLTADWWAPSGSWTDVSGGKQGRSGGDAFYLSDATGSDFTYEGDVRIDSGTAAALTFRASTDLSQHYTVNVDAQANVVKLWRPGRDIATYPLQVVRGRTYHLKVVAQGSRFRVYLDHGDAPVIDATDASYASGHFGLNVFNGTAVMQNVNVDGAGFTTNLAGPWTPASGVWTSPTGTVEGRSGGDGFYLSQQSGSDFTYEGDVQLANGVAAALTFRASDDLTRHYTVNIDALAGVVKLWRPGRDIAAYPTTIVPGRTYHLKVVAEGSRFRVYLDGGATPIIDATDDTIASGRFGLNVFNGIGVFDNVEVGPPPG